MEEVRDYLFKRMQHLCKSIDTLNTESSEAKSSAQAADGVPDLENVQAFVARRVAYLPSQIDSALRELITVCQSLRDVNSAAVKLTGSLTGQPPQQLFQGAELQPPPRLGDVRPQRPKLSTAKSASDLRPPTSNPGHPAHRQRTDAQSELPYNKAGGTLTTEAQLFPFLLSAHEV